MLVVAVWPVLLVTKNNISRTAWAVSNGLATTRFMRYGTSGIVATGFSCRSQVKRVENKRVKHPLEVILRGLTSTLFMSMLTFWL